MKETINLIEKVLNQEEYYFLNLEKKDDVYFIALAFEYSDVGVMVSEFGEYIRIFSTGKSKYRYLNKISEDKKNILLKELLNENYTKKVIKWSLDSDDGELMVSAELGLEDMKLTEKSFLRAFNSVVKNAEQKFKEISEAMSNKIEE